NGVYLYALGFERARQSTAVAADLLKHALGTPGSKAISLLVMVSALGAMNGMIFTGARVYSAMGTEFRVFAWLGRWNPRRGSPLGAPVTQMAITLVMIAAVGTERGGGLVTEVVGELG